MAAVAETKAGTRMENLFSPEAEEEVFGTSMKRLARRWVVELSRSSTARKACIMSGTREQQLLKDYLQAKRGNDDERLASIIAIALTNAELDQLLWDAECELAKDEIARITPEDRQRIKAAVETLKRQFEG